MTPRRLVNRARRLVARAVRGAQDRTLGRLYLRRPLDPHLVVYTTLWHRTPRGNPLAIYRAQQEFAPHLRGVWIVRRKDVPSIPDGFDYVRPRTIAYLKLTATASYFVDDANPYWSLPPREGQVYVQTHHGTALKYMGADRHYSGKRPSDTSIVTMHRRAQRWTHSLTTGPYLTEVWERAYQNGCVQLPTGFPRNDALVRPSPQRRADARARLGLEDHHRAVLYMPTWRTRLGPREGDFDLEAFATAMPDDVRLLVRDHYFHDAGSHAHSSERLIEVSVDWEVEDLYLASDLLVTDYSSAMFDYALVDRPIVLFCHDWDRYRFERGTYFDVVADPPGQVVHTAAQLLASLVDEEYESPDHAARRASYRERFSPYDRGDAAERVVRQALLGETPASRDVSLAAERHPSGWTTHPPVTHPDDPAIEPLLPPVGPTPVSGATPLDS